MKTLTWLNTLAICGISEKLGMLGTGGYISAIILVTIGFVVDLWRHP